MAGGGRGATRAAGVSAAPSTLARLRARVDGVVQGVGFRPFVYGLAREQRLAGWVCNDTRGVLLEVEGEPEALKRFLDQLATQPPPLANVESVQTEPQSPTGECGFRILASVLGGEHQAPVSPDAAPCANCLAELFDPQDRRYRYPFINCTDCGPRLTIVLGVPYDRELTTMRGFKMCPACRSEYEDPRSRRFHAQPNACPVCGPAARLIDGAGRPAASRPSAATAALGTSDAITTAAAALTSGAIIAVKGVGGYHLACRADDERAVAELRKRKHRPEKPFAVMAPDLAAARQLVKLSDHELELISGRERPIVIARRRPTANVAASVAPGSPDLGVMLPATPLHHLLLADAGTTLVMTSGNLSDEPIAFQDDDALTRLAAGCGPAARPRPADRCPCGRFDRAFTWQRPRSAAAAGGHAAMRPARSACPSRRRRCWRAERAARARSAWPRAPAPGSGRTSATSRTGRRCARLSRGSPTLRRCSRLSRLSSRMICTRTTSPPATRSGVMASS